MSAPDSDIQSLISSVINENRFSHCRLCLKYLESQFVRFHDLVTLDSNHADFVPLSSVMTQIFVEDLTSEIPGIDAVCTDCVEKILETARFLEKCKNANKKLNSVLDNFAETLNTEIDLSGQDQTLYIVVEEEETKMIFIKKENHKEAPKGKKFKRFECFQCIAVFPDLDELKTHNLTNHGDLTCEVCLDTYGNDVELAYHINNAHKYECKDCNVRKDTEDQLKKHIDNSHSLYFCKDCGTICEGQDKFRSHKHKHNSNRKNQCPKCGKVYSTKDFFLKHVKLCMEDRIDPHPIRTEIKKSFVCNICGKGYSNYGGLRVHTRFVHGDAKPHVCKQCGKEFTAPSYLKTHMIKHTGEKNFKCDICGNRFVSKEALLYHTRRHTGERPYSCKHCNERFVNASARAEHIKFKHVGPTLMCEICSQKFVTSQFLKQHMNRHHDPTSKLYVSRTLPANMPGEENLKVKIKNKNTIEEVKNESIKVEIW